MDAGGRAGNSVPDKRRHRGPHPDDLDQFAAIHWPALQNATRDLSWLLSRNYSMVAGLKLVGDRYGLTRRQRLGVQRSACSDWSRSHRQATQVAAAQLSGRTVEIDGFNLLTTVEAALAGGVILEGCDSCYRDMASVHGTFRLMQETTPAIEMIGEVLRELGITRSRWLLDKPVSNSGRLASEMRRIASQQEWDWSVELVPSPDEILAQSTDVVATADSVILDRCSAWCNLARYIIDQRLPQATVVPMQAATNPAT